MRFKTVDEFYTGAGEYVALFDAFATKHALADVAAADHVCFKCESKEEYESLRALFEQESDFVYQSIISKRRIAYVKFKKPLHTTLGDIYFLELSDQKPDGSQKSGFDHIEVYPVTTSYQAFVGKLGETEKVVRVERPHHSTDDIEIGSGFLFRCTEGPLIEKIKSSEFL